MAGAELCLPSLPGFAVVERLLQRVKNAPASTKETRNEKPVSTGADRPHRREGLAAIGASYASSTSQNILSASGAVSPHRTLTTSPRDPSHPNEGLIQQISRAFANLVIAARSNVKNAASIGGN